MKTITGSWLDIQHPNPNAIWNRETAGFTHQDWGTKIREMAHLGLDTQVLLSVAVYGKSFYPSKVIKDQWDLACSDPIDALLQASDEAGTGLYLGLGFFDQSISHLPKTPAELRLHQDVAEELMERYGHHPSFTGWYLPVEAHIPKYFTPEYIEYTQQMAQICRRCSTKPRMIAPYGTRTVCPDARYVQQLHELGVEIIAYQDEVGVEKTTCQELPDIFRGLHQAHAQSSVTIWADIELFAFSGQVYKSPAIPAPMERVREQIQGVSPYVEKILSYQYLGLMNPPETQAFAGDPSSVQLYQDYVQWMSNLK